jgi:hypothetical protein
MPRTRGQSPCTPDRRTDVKLTKSIWPNS